MALDIDRIVLALPREQYVRTRCEKTLLVLHHTVGGSVESTFTWWKQDPRKIATAYLIARDGEIYECFEPSFWASHVGVPGNVAVEKRSIGIELASEGALRSGAELNSMLGSWGLEERFAPMSLYAFDIDATRPRTNSDVPFKGAKALYDLRKDAGRFIALDIPFRGYRYFDMYETAQWEAAIALLDELCTRFRIPRTLLPDTTRPDPKLAQHRAETVTGIVPHAALRPDKSDVHPLFPWHQLEAAFDRAA